MPAGFVTEVVAVRVHAAGAEAVQDDVQEIAAEEGASPELFEAVVIEMMARGARAEPAEVSELIAEVGAVGDS